MLQAIATSRSAPQGIRGGLTHAEFVRMGRIAYRSARPCVRPTRTPVGFLDCTHKTMHRSVAILRLALPLVLMLVYGTLVHQLAHGAEPEQNAKIATDADQERAFQEQIRPLVDKYCARCHGGADPQAGLNLARFEQAAAVKKSTKTWKKALDQLRAGTMPPDDELQPTADERQALAGWLDRWLFEVDCSQERDPGRTTIRRLNRAEYRNTIRDLLGVEFDTSANFPTDDVGYGFDNIGDVLAMPPILLEKYVAAAEKISAQAMSRPDLTRPLARFDASSMSGGNDSGGSRGLFSSGEVEAQVQFDVKGRYAVTFTAFAQQAGPENAKMSIRIDGQEASLVEVAGSESDPLPYEVQIEVESGPRRLSAAFVNDYYRPDDPDPNQRDRNLYIVALEVRGPLDQPAGPPPESYRRIMIADPAAKGEPTAETETAAARKIFKRFAAHAYRRPATERELSRLVDFAMAARAEGEDFDHAIQLGITAILVSPHFLFHVEVDKEPDNPRAIHPISPFEMASRLSYFLWSSMPDAELFKVARQGSLRQPEVLAEQTLRMLKDPKARALVDNFASQWLTIRRLETVSPDRERFAAFDDDLRRDMRTETELFFQEIVREDRSVLDFLDADFTYLNERLARHYGISTVSGSEFQRFSLAGKKRGGVLSQASVLTVTSNPTRTSPVKRGKWILEQLLGAAPPSPPAGVEELKEEGEGALTGTLRQKMEQHRTKASCANCHAAMDPLGFGLENYDAIGAWRDTDDNQPIDASGTLPDGRGFAGPAELKAVLLERKDEFLRCLAEKLLTYALGRGLETYDKCALDDLVQAMKQKDHRFSALVLAIVESQPFQFRRGRDPEVSD